jgi:hypothetical protein
MAEKVLLSRTARTQVCLESAYGTAGSWVDLYPSGRPEITREREPVPLSDERPTAFAHQRPVRGLRSWSGKLGVHVRASAAQLNAAATPSTPPNLMLLKGLLGGEHAAAGSTVASATTTTITVASGHGTRFPKGSIGAVVISGAPVPFVVVDRDSDELTVYPTLPSAPAESAVVLNSYCYYPTQSNTQSVGLRHAQINHASPSDYDQQFEHLGGTGDFSLTIEDGQTAKLEYELRGKPWSGPSSAPSMLPAPAATETQGAPFVTRNALVLWQPLATATRTHCPVRKLSLKFASGMLHLGEHGGVESCSGVARAGDGYMFVEGEITKLYDPAFDAFYESETDLGLWHVTPLGSGADTRLLVVHVPTMFLGQKPQTPDDGGLVVHTHTWQAMEDGRVVSPDTDLARAPIRVALI